MSAKINKVSLAGLIIALGIVYGDIGTSPLYTISAIMRGRVITDNLVLGAESCIIWTLTLLTTVKYIWFTLRADNKGEGGIFSLYALVRRHGKKIIFLAMIGGAMLLADGLITPPITVTSAVEGLGQSENITVGIVIIILSLIFFMQQFGTNWIGKLYGPVMVLWFLMMAIMGTMHVLDDWRIFKAFNPYYAIHFLVTYPKGFWLLGSVFLCTTGAESLYSDLGHCGRANIRYSWIYVKTCLVLSYVGQGAWLLQHYRGAVLPPGVNPFFDIMPEWFRTIGVVIAGFAAIIASQALISGSFTLVSEGIKMNLWPKMRVIYPTNERGQIYIPGINILLWVFCTLIVLHFRRSADMEGAYGLSIALTMVMTSLLFAFYLYTRRTNKVLVALFLLVYVTVEGSFFVANLEKFEHGGYVSLINGGVIFLIMYIWYRARKIKNRYVEFSRLDDYLPIIQELNNDRTIPKYATHLVYLTSADNPKEIENKIINSILYQNPKRADIYWFIHVHVVDDPYRTDYVVETLIPNEVVRIEFRLGFRIEHRIQMMFRKVVRELVQNKEVNVMSRYESLSRNNVRGDFRFIVMEKFLSHDNELKFIDKLIMRAYFLIKKTSLSEERSFGLDQSDVVIEKIPLIVSETGDIDLRRVTHHSPQ